ncbi:MAG: asparagine synthetase B, partial [Bacteroidota bacterium]
GVAYWAISKGIESQWLLNYRGGSFAMAHQMGLEAECRLRGISYEVIAENTYATILAEIQDPAVNMELVKLEKAPRIAVYTPPTKQPWDDAVTMALTYAEIPYDKVYDPEVLDGKLPMYDWLHLHHEDFTGQFGRFYFAYRNAAWYQAEVAEAERTALSRGFTKVSQLKSAVAQRIREFVAGGGFLFAMCSATDSYDIALSAIGLDICESMYDGDPAAPSASSRLDYDQCLAFKDFTLTPNPLEYEFSDIDVTNTRGPMTENEDFIALFDFSAKWDVVPTMLCQNHQQVIKGFMGQTTAFNKDLIKPEVLIMGETKSLHEARYIHGNFGKGTWTFYGGHDPEDYQHLVGEPPTELSMHPNSPGYRLILNNILFPAAKKKKQKT